MWGWGSDEDGRLRVAIYTYIPRIVICTEQNGEQHLGVRRLPHIMLVPKYENTRGPLERPLCSSFICLISVVVHLIQCTCCTPYDPTRVPLTCNSGLLMRKSVVTSQQDYNQAQPPVRIRRFSHQILQRRRERYRRTVENDVGQNRVSATGKQGRKETSQRGAQCLQLSYIGRW